jgi:drug/metabolite transporter (DMT)-like permease
MNHSILSIILIVALLQTCSWIVRKKVSNENLHQHTIIVAESVIITIVLFSYIFNMTTPNKMYKELKDLDPIIYFYLLITALCVVGSIVLIFNLINVVEISKLGPVVSIMRIIMLVVFGFLIFNEKVTMRKVISLIFMILGVGLMVKS